MNPSMVPVVLDSSVLLATLFEESAVSLSVLLHRASSRGVPIDVMAASIGRLTVRVIPTDSDQAIAAAKLRRFAAAPDFGEEVWFCLALAKSTGRRVLTTQAAWQDLCVGVDVEVIR